MKSAVVAKNIMFKKEIRIKETTSKRKESNNIQIKVSVPQQELIPDIVIILKSHKDHLQ
jgi:hypothetical protein